MAAVELDIAPPTMEGEKFRDLFSVQEILLEYLPDSFTLRNIDAMPPAEYLQGVIDQAVEIARSLGDHGVLNTDV